MGTTLRKGLRGTVDGYDEEGDAWIKFLAFPYLKCVRRENLDKLQLPYLNRSNTPRPQHWKLCDGWNEGDEVSNEGSSFFTDRSTNGDLVQEGRCFRITEIHSDRAGRVESVTMIELEGCARINVMRRYLERFKNKRLEELAGRKANDLLALKLGQIGINKVRRSGWCVYERGSFKTFHNSDSGKLNMFGMSMT